MRAAEDAPAGQPALVEVTYNWRIDLAGAMRVQGIMFASRHLPPDLAADRSLAQVASVPTLRGIVNASYATPDMNGGYGFPIGGVAATDAADGGVVSPGDVGFAIFCGVRPLAAGLSADVAKPYGRVGQPVLVPGPMGTALTSWPGSHRGHVPSRCATARRKLSHEPACRPAAGLCARTWPPRESRSGCLGQGPGREGVGRLQGRDAWSRSARRAGMASIVARLGPLGVVQG